MNHSLGTNTFRVFQCLILKLLTLFFLKPVILLVFIISFLYFKNTVSIGLFPPKIVVCSFNIGEIMLVQLHQSDGK